MKKWIHTLLAFVLCISLVGCASKKEDGPKKTVTAFFDAYKAQNFKDLSNYIDGVTPTEDFDFTDETDELGAEYQAEFLKKLTDISYDIKEENIQGKEATVVVSITAYNIGEKFAEGFGAALELAFSLQESDISEEEINQKVMDAMLTPIKNAEKNYTSEVEMKLIQKDGQWLISGENSDDLFNAITGGMMNLGSNFED